MLFQTERIKPPSQRGRDAWREAPEGVQYALDYSAVVPPPGGRPPHTLNFPSRKHVKYSLSIRAASQSVPK